MTAVLVRCLAEGRDQFNKRYPKRDKSSDGWIGDTAHQTGPSSHNPDKTGTPEWRDGDSRDEVRAIDVDADLHDPDVTTEQQVQNLVEGARSGRLWWIGYIIFNGRIWHDGDGFKTHAYTGVNKHDKHFHINSEFTQHADDVTGTNWGLENFGRTPAKPDHLAVDGLMGKLTVKRWQEVTNNPTGKTGIFSKNFVEHIQRRLKDTVDHRLVVDGIFGPNSIRALERYLGAPLTGKLDPKIRSEAVVALQRRLNENRY
jgi:hypothetical protein